MRSSFVVPLSQLRGFSPAQLASGAEFRFEWPQEAGTLAFEGIDRWWWWPAGQFTFERDAEFTSRLSGTFDDHDLLRLALHGGGNRLLEQMAQIGYTTLTASDLLHLEDYGVEPDLIRATQDLEVRPTVDELIALRR